MLKQKVNYELNFFKGRLKQQHQASCLPERCQHLPEAPSLSSLSPVLQGSLASTKRSQGEIKASLIYSFTWRLQVALPTDPLNTSQKLVISFPSVLICLKDNKSQAVFVLSGLWFRMWQPYSLQLKYWILGLNTVSPENSPALCCLGVEHAVIIVTTIHNYLIRNTPLPACIYSQMLRNGLDFRDSIRGQNILRIFSFPY